MVELQGRFYMSRWGDHSYQDEDPGTLTPASQWEYTTIEDFALVAGGLSARQPLEHETPMSGSPSRSPTSTAATAFSAQPPRHRAGSRGRTTHTTAHSATDTSATDCSAQSRTQIILPSPLPTPVQLRPRQEAGSRSRTTVYSAITSATARSAQSRTQVVLPPALSPKHLP
ncbi:hypothetical protein SARC_11852 [Sphaeroforma arctica JP610]|uniref:Uncharacterized protein n=1 Tax=Sphaeroforma arctica JP610 TaxID=667725 RepID=A0A0L0FFW2_9EUKA|nr:hypothetical protein SARC_11852 [Sphaeroforma arctica JP610]KNC75630.1 hypothetical protein SARC_11852 [Sphaeroforma arctica JP610]|eukprot:XP_014149532.1 hypothetical protein SARC_11852 [Sphaeroforma arctica JP610]